MISRGSTGRSPPLAYLGEKRMARYEHLPIYKKAVDLTIYGEQIVRNFSRYHKYILGSELWHKSREVVELIVRANSRVERLPLLLDRSGCDIAPCGEGV